MRHGHDHVLALDQVLVLDLARLVEIAVRRGVANSSFTALSSSLTIAGCARASAGCRDSRDLGRELVELVLDLVAAERGQPLQAQVEDRRPARRTAGRCRRRHPVARIVDQRDQRPPCPWPASRAPSGLARLVGVARGADQRITSSMLATAMARPTSTWARSRALPSRNLVRRDTTSSRNATKAAACPSGSSSRAGRRQRHHVGAEARSAAA
jgi:hypothetical protein